jgi:hypothetical protein
VFPDGGETDPLAEPAASSEEDAGESGETTEPSKPVIKCVLCDVALTRSDRPMLLECLHSACSACIEAKLQEQPDQEHEVVGECFQSEGVSYSYALCCR